MQIVTFFMYKTDIVPLLTGQPETGFRSSYAGG